MTTQQQIKVSVSSDLNALLKLKAQEVGIPVTQYIKNLIINDVKQYSTYKASDFTEKRAKMAMDELQYLKPVKDLQKYLDNL